MAPKVSVGDAEPYSLEHLKDMADNFDFLIDETMYGRLFDDNESKVIIKTWDFFVPCRACYSDHPSRFCVCIRTLKADVYIFGVLLVELIANKGNIPIPHCDWIGLMLLQRGRRSIVDKSLLQDNDELANSITRIAAACLDEDPIARPDMKDVFARLVQFGKGSNSNNKVEEN
ncbi:PREDICTED: cysteine-rich receptor-like protein kinase 27 [Nicotiana attenuata]|uniref:cysteine-rich receptor-like protein kinase 27 n=1 Tax=Nicotiana attenuata TaxID=49451 RepID=UPI00090528AE|nr:PREDICTED: cysteine-rich receptor-like protein kinase 27 [Nicotiana attenuata]